ncbi:MAG: hypothetical protein CFE21_05465 [Bacteroidetes bacterium B1(2017)]|nr:MAG: hypothetical protein CFE21_05465 [Bacteroidetes bacterium B1(2017)]
MCCAIALSSMAQDKKKGSIPPPPPKPTELPAKPAAKVLDAMGSLNAFYTNLNTYFAGNNPNLEPISRFMASDFMFIRNTENVAGDVKTVRWNSEETLRDLKATKDLNIRAERKILKVVFNQTVGNLANISVMVDLKYLQDTTVVAAVKAYTTHSMVFENGQWKIKNMITDRVAENQTIGACPCRITRTMVDRNDLYTARIMYPNGSGFESEELQVSFKGEGALSIITVGNNYFTWKENVIYTAKVGESSTVENLGKASSNTEAITVILAKGLYKSQCLKFEPLK